MPEDNKETELNLEEITAKDNESISEPERTFLMENKSSLTEDEAKKFEIEQDTKVEPTTPQEPQVRVPLPTSEEKKTEPKPDPEDDLDLDGRKTAKEEAEKAVAPIGATVQGIKDSSDADSYIRDNPEYAKYREAMLVYMKHKDHKNVAVENIAAIVSAKDQQAIGAQKERESQKKANDTKESGDPSRDSGTKQDWKTASKDDVKTEVARVLGRQGN